MIALRLLIPTLAAAALLAGCERPPMQSHQQGLRGTGMVQIDNPRILAAQRAAVPPVPVSSPPLPADGPKARDVFQNVKVLGDLSAADFTRHMLAITQWVAPPEQGCNYCHDAANLAADTKYTKLVARRMIEMTRHVNAQWKPHVGDTGVTCYTCHRGQPLPQQMWFTALPAQRNRVGVGMGEDAGQNKAEPSIALASLPYEPFTDLLAGGPEGSAPVRVQTVTALPTDNRMSIKQAEWTYSLMNHMSKSLGVNCTFCHNTQSFQSWNGPVQRVTAWHGIRMARDVNHNYLTPLASTFPAHRRGPAGDVAKVFCATCHQGVNKPLGGLQMARDFPGLSGPAAAAPAAAASATAVAPAAPEAPRAAVPAAAEGRRVLAAAPLAATAAR